VAELLERARAATPDCEALVGRRARYTYAELDQVADAAASALHDMGARPGTRVAASLPNQTEIVVAFLGAMRLGAIWVGINTALAPPEKAHMLRDCGASLLIATPAVVESLAGEDVPLRASFTVDTDTGEGTWSTLLATRRGTPPVRERIDPHAPAAIAYTSGTTGFPKGAVHSQHNMLWPGVDARANDPAPADERHGVMLPLTLLNLQILGPLFAFAKGTTCVCVDRTDPVGLTNWIRAERITRLTAVPAVLHDLLSHPDVDARDLVSLRRPECGGTATPHAFRELFRSRFGTDVLTGYGLTEAPTAVTREMPGDDLVDGCSGRPFAPLDIVIVDERGGALPPARSVRSACGPGPRGRGPACTRRSSATGASPTPPATRCGAGCCTPTTSAWSTSRVGCS
jgi:acyl-CoA synthetase (AMP-forming)/AMP-acid ligase II